MTHSAYTNNDKITTNQDFKCLPVLFYKVYGLDNLADKRRRNLLDSNV